jgi:hypothetical protein
MGSTFAARRRKPMADYPTPPLPEQQQPMPGFTKQMNPFPIMANKAIVAPAGLRARRLSSPAATAVSAGQWPSPMRVKVPTC